jgi:hypothetical protein
MEGHTPDGERQWLSADGNWYSSESAALLAGIEQAKEHRQRAPSPGDPLVVRLPPPPSVPPVIRQRQVQPSKRRRFKPRFYVIMAVLAVAIVWIAVASSHHTPYKIARVSIEHAGTAHVYVEFQVHNLSGSSWKPSCQVQVQPPLDQFFGVTQGASTYTPIDGHQYGMAGAEVTITNNDALEVTPSDVQVSNC